MKHIKYSYLTAFSLLLGGCAQTPVIVENYDEFKKTKVCKLNPYLIRNECRISTSRATDITLETQPDGSIKAILTSRIIQNIFLNYDSFSPRSKIKFILTTPDQKTEELIFQGQDNSTTHDSHVVYGQYATVTLPVVNALLTFTMTAEQLRKIIAAPKTEFYFESGKDPIKGELSDSNKAAFKQFLDKCAPLGGNKQ